jgi:hypothetical protein
MSAVVHVQKHPKARGMQGFELVTSVFSAIHVPQASNNTKNITSNASITRYNALCNSFGGWGVGSPSWHPSFHFCSIVFGQDFLPPLGSKHKVVSLFVLHDSSQPCIRPRSRVR